MRKINIFYIIFISLLLFSAVQAQVPGNLPPIDVSAAKDYLGTWYLESMCAGEEGCMSPSDFGMTGILEIKADNTMILSGISDEAEEPAYWYMENGTAYFLNIGQFETEEFEMLIDDQGRFIMGDDETSLIFSREQAVALGMADIDTEAHVDDFLGKWYVNTLLTHGMNFPLGTLGLNGILEFFEDRTFNITLDEESLSGVPYEVYDNILSAEIPDADGETFVLVNFEYHLDGTLVFVGYPMSVNEIRISFTREQSTVDPSVFGESGF